MTRGHPPWTIEKFLNNVKPNTDGCWPCWLRSRDRCGYAVVRHQGTVWQAHRLAWSLFNGPIPEKCELHHKCERRDCVNPFHLQLISRADHYRLHDHEARKTHCAKGHPLSGDNLYVVGYGSQRGRRLCLICMRTSNTKAVARYRAKEKARFAI